MKLAEQMNLKMCFLIIFCFKLVKKFHLYTIMELRTI